MMKKVILLMMVAVLGMATANAQMYLGGSIGFGLQSIKADVDGAESQTSTSFLIAPEFGYSLDEKLDLGISVLFGTSQQPSSIADEKIKITNWGVAPFVRYSFVDFGKFSVLGKAEIYVEGGKTKTPISVDTTSELKNTAFGLNVMPVLKYSLSEKFDLLANLNFASVGFRQNKIKDGDKTTTFGIGVDTFDVANLGGGDVPFTIGFAFRF